MQHKLIMENFRNFLKTELSNNQASSELTENDLQNIIEEELMNVLKERDSKGTGGLTMKNIRKYGGGFLRGLFSGDRLASRVTSKLARAKKKSVGPSARKALNRYMAYLPSDFKRGYKPRGFPAVVVRRDVENPKAIAFVSANTNKVYFNILALNQLQRRFDTIFRVATHRNSGIDKKKLKMYMEEIMSALLANVMVQELTHVRQYNVAMLGRNFKYAPSAQELATAEMYESAIMSAAEGVETEATANQIHELEVTTKPQIERILRKISNIVGRQNKKAMKYITDNVNRIVDKSDRMLQTYYDVHYLADVIKMSDRDPNIKSPSPEEREKEAEKYNLPLRTFKQKWQK